MSRQGGNLNAQQKHQLKTLKASLAKEISKVRLVLFVLIILASFLTFPDTATCSTSVDASITTENDSVNDDVSDSEALSTSLETTSSMFNSSMSDSDETELSVIGIFH